MKVMMLDRNSIIDRRIALEAETLMAQGIDVELICAEGKLGEWDSHKFRVTKFTVYPQDSGGETKHPSLDTAKIQDFRARWKKIFGQKLSLLIGTVVHPKQGKRFAVTANSLVAWQRYLLLAILNVQTLRPGYFASGLGEAARWFWNFLRALAFPHSAPDLLDPWSARVIEYLDGQDFDVIHVHDLPVLPLGVYLKKRLSKVLVYDAHELYSYQPGLGEKSKRDLFRSEKKFIGAADLVVLINEDQAQIMQKDFGQFPYVALTNATTEPKDFDISQRYSLIKKACGIDDSSKTILFQGGINRNRKIDLLIEGAALSKAKPHLVFLTWGGEVEEFKDFSRNLGIADRVHFLNPVPWDQMIFWAASADLGVMPYQPNDLNTTLSMPNKMYEFIVAGTPMIGSNGLINVKKIVGDNGMGVLRPLVSAQDYASLIDLALDPTTHERCRQNILRHRDRYSWKNLSKDFVEAYLKLERNISAAPRRIHG